MDADEASGNWPTFETLPVKEVVAYAERFVRQAATKPQGAPLALVGPPGSGKTHAIFFAHGRFLKAAATQLPPQRQPVIVYVKAEGPDFALLYREITKSLSLALFRELAGRGRSG